MIKTSPGIIGLVTTLSGIHAHFTHHNRELEVTLETGNLALGEMIIGTSAKLDGKLYINFNQGDVQLSVWDNEGTLRYREVFDSQDHDDRSHCRKLAIAILDDSFEYVD